MALVRRSLLTLGALAAPAMLSRSIHAQGGLPIRSARIFVGFERGGGADAVAQTVATKLERRLSIHVSVERRTGSYGAVPGELLKKGPADGSQLALLSSTTLVSRLTAKEFPFDPIADLAPTTLAGTFSIALTVSPQTGVRTFKDYLRWLKAGDASRRRIAISSNTAFLEVMNIMLGQAIGEKLTMVSYRGAIPVVNDLQDGAIPAAVNTITSVLPAHRGGQVRILMHTGKERLQVAPDIPTATELGFPSLEMEEWFAFFLPARTPAPLVATWNHKLGAALDDPEVVAEMKPLGLKVSPSSIDDLTLRIFAHRAEWEQRLKMAGLTVN